MLQKVFVWAALKNHTALVKMLLIFNLGLASTKCGTSYPHGSDSWEIATVGSDEHQKLTVLQCHCDVDYIIRDRKILLIHNKCLKIEMLALIIGMRDAEPKKPLSYINI